MIFLVFLIFSFIVIRIMDGHVCCIAIIIFFFFGIVAINISNEYNTFDIL